MIYAATVTTSANTAVTEKKHTPLYVSKGLVYRVAVEFPPGPAGLCYVAIYDGGFQLWPRTPGIFFHSDNAVIGFDDLYKKETEPFMFDVVTYNLDDTYSHTIQVRIGLVSEKVYMARFMPHLSWDYFKQAMLELAQEQEQQKQASLAQPFSFIGS